MRDLDKAVAACPYCGQPARVRNTRKIAAQVVCSWKPCQASGPAYYSDEVAHFAVEKWNALIHKRAGGVDEAGRVIKTLLHDFDNGIGQYGCRDIGIVEVRAWLNSRTVHWDSLLAESGSDGPSSLRPSATAPLARVSQERIDASPPSVEAKAFRYAARELREGLDGMDCSDNPMLTTLVALFDQADDALLATEREGRA